MDALLKSLIKWLPTNIGALIGIAQAVVKFVKEVCTLAIDIIAPILKIPGLPPDADDKVIAAVRNICNVVDSWLEKIKTFLFNVV